MWKSKKKKKKVDQYEDLYNYRDFVKDATII